MTNDKLPFNDLPFEMSVGEKFKIVKDMIQNQKTSYFQLTIEQSISQSKSLHSQIEETRIIEVKNTLIQIEKALDVTKEIAFDLYTMLDDEAKKKYPGYGTKKV